MRILRLHLLCTAATIAAPALAQDDPIPLGRVIFGTGEPKVAIDTPQVFTVIDQEDHDQYQPTTTAELFDLAPGTQAIGSERVGGLSFNIRGIGELQAADESRIIVTVDGATKFYEQYRLGSSFSDPDLYRRVEVLRGPASATLYGAGAIGGVIGAADNHPRRTGRLQQPRSRRRDSRCGGGGAHLVLAEARGALRAVGGVVGVRLRRAHRAGADARRALLVHLDRAAVARPRPRAVGQHRARPRLRDGRRLRHGDALTLKATAFHYAIENLIERLDAPGTPYYANVGSAEIRGLELEGSYSAERSFARLACSDVDGEDTETGGTLTSVPARTLAVTLGGRLPEYDVDYGWRGTFVDDITSPRDEEFHSYATHDFFVGWRPEEGPLEGFEVRASVENAFDETYRNSELSPLRRFSGAVREPASDRASLETCSEQVGRGLKCSPAASLALVPKRWLPRTAR